MKRRQRQPSGRGTGTGRARRYSLGPSALRWRLRFVGATAMEPRCKRTRRHVKYVRGSAFRFMRARAKKYEATHASIEAVLYTPAVPPVPGLLHNQIKLQYRTIMPSSHQQRRFPSRAASGGLAASPFAAAAARVVGPFLATAGTAAAPAACKALPRAPAPGLACPLAGAVTPHPRL